MKDTGAVQHQNEIYEAKRSAAVHALQAFMKSAGLATIPLSVYAASMPEVPEWRRYHTRKYQRRAS